MTLTDKNIKTGILVMNIQHPEWGTWVVEKDPTTYVIRGNRGGKILIPSEYHFWKIV